MRKDETRQKDLMNKHLCVCLRKNLRENVYGMLLVYFNVIFHGNCSKLIWDYWELHRQDAWINVIKIDIHKYNASGEQLARSPYGINYKFE